METKNAASLGEVIDLGVVCNLRLCNRDMGQRCCAQHTRRKQSNMKNRRIHVFKVGRRVSEVMKKR